MPLRDHFRPPLNKRNSWEGFHAQWPAMLVQQLSVLFPERFVVEPRVHLGAYFSEPSDYEVLVYDAEDDRRLVAAIEFVSPANKDRPEHRRAFVAKCAALIQRQVCVSIVDVVTVRQFNLYADLLDLIDRSDPALGADPPAIYAVTCRSRKAGGRPLLDTWLFPLQVGLPLPTLPLWLGEELKVPLELEPSYEQTCRALRIS